MGKSKMDNYTFLATHYPNHPAVKKMVKRNKCPNCGGVNTRSYKRACSHGRKCNVCGHVWCSYYMNMSKKERLLRRDFFRKHGGKEEEGARYLWTGIEDDVVKSINRSERM